MAASSQGVRAGRAFVEMFLDDKKMLRALDAVKARFASFASFTGKMSAALGGAGGLLFAPLTKLLLDAAKYGSQIGGLAKLLGQTTESVSVLAGAAQQAGIDVDEFGEMMKSLAVRVSHAADANEYLSDSLRSIGRGRELLNMPLNELADRIAESVGNIKVSADQLRAMGDLGLPEGMLKLLRNGKAGLDAARAASKAGGWQMSDEQAKQSKAVTEALTAAWAGFKGILLEVGAALLSPAGAMGDLSARVKEAMNDARQWVTEHKGLIVSVAAGAAGLVALGSAFGVMSTAAAAAIPVIIGLKMAVVATAAVLAAVVSPAGLMIGAIAGVTAGLLYLWSTTEQGKGTLAEVSSAFGEFAEFLKGSWQGIGDALSAGDWTLAFRISIATAQVAWAKFVNGITIVWVGVKDTFVNVWREATTGIRLLFLDLAGAIGKIMSTAIQGVVDAWNYVAGKIDDSLKIDLAGIMLTPEQVDQKTERDKKGVRDEKADKDRAAQKARDKQLSDANDRVREAQKELDDLKNKAAKEARQAREGSGGGYFGIGSAIGKGIFNAIGALPKRPPLPTPTQLFEAQKGTFQGPIGQMMSLGDSLGKRQLDAALAIATNTAPLPQAAKDLNALAAGMRFK